LDKSPPGTKLTTLVVPEGWNSLQPDQAQQQGPMERARVQLAEEVLPSYLTTRRWYAAKQSRIHRVSLREVLQWRDWLLALVCVELDTAAQQDYFLPLSIQWDGQVEHTATGAQAAALARVRHHAKTGLLCDALADGSFVRAIAAAMVKGGEVRLVDGRLLFSPVGEPADWLPTAGVASVRIPTEGSNSAAILEDRLFLKTYRRLSAGINPEVEIGRFLTEVSPFAHIAPLVGALEYQTSEGDRLSLGVLQRYVPNQGDLWAHTLNLLERLGEESGDRGADWDTDPAQIAYAALIDTLGQRVAELHHALAQPGGGEAFDPEPISDSDLAVLRERIQHEAATTLERLQLHLTDLGPDAQTQARTLLGERDTLAAYVDALVPDRLQAAKMRCHADLHLGQVLVVENDVLVIDFEGEPARPLLERRAKQSPLVDVAGLVRSFHYAGANALVRLSQDNPDQHARLTPIIARWTREMTRRLLASYEGAAAGSPGFPAPAAQARDLIGLFALQKALYEIRYELDNRPHWVRIPVEGVLELVSSQ